MSDPGDSDCADESWDSNDADDDDDGFADYYSFNDGDEEGRASQFNNNDDPEYFAYECLTVANVEKIFNESIETVQSSLGVSHARAKQILHTNKWNIGEIMTRFTPRVPSPPHSSSASPVTVETLPCSVCILDLPADQFMSLKGKDEKISIKILHCSPVSGCGHSFCVECWNVHCETQISTGVTTTLSCMMPECDTILDEDLVLAMVTNPRVRERYIHLSFIDYVR